MKLTTALGAAMFSACMTPALGAEFSFAYYDASLELVDLTPDDGVAPSIFFPPGFGFDSAAVTTLFTHTEYRNRSTSTGSVPYFRPLVV